MSAIPSSVPVAFAAVLLGHERYGLVALTPDGNGVAEILFLATARDFARIGLYVQERLMGKVEMAASFEEQARRLANEMEGLQKGGHVGASKPFDKGEFRAAFDTMKLQDLRIL